MFFRLDVYDITIGQSKQMLFTTNIHQFIDKNRVSDRKTHLKSVE